MTKLIYNHQPAHSEINTEMIAICSAVGGAGRTAITVNLASLLAQRHMDVRIIDGDLQFGDAALALDLQPSVSMKEIVERGEFEKASDYCMKHSSGIELLAAPTRPEYADLITPEILVSITESLKSGTQILLVDTQVGLTEQSIQVMEKADRILVVTTPSMAALKNTRMMVETLDALKMKPKVRLLVNKFNAESVVKANEIPALIQLEQAYYLPYDIKHVSQSLDVGIPVVQSKPKLDFSKGMERLADELFTANRYGESSKQSKTGFMKKWANHAKEMRGEGNEFISKTAIKSSGRS